MSKASAWSQNRRAAIESRERIEDEQPNFRRMDVGILGGELVAMVDTDGSPFFEDIKGRWPTDQAVALARWILDTFGEQP